MNMRTCLLLALAALPCWADSPGTAAIRGKLVREAGQPALEIAGGKRVTLDGDADTRGVLNDKRLAGVEMELRGRLNADGRFLVDPIHTRAVHVHKNGKKLFVTYWCDVCAIRTYTPGICWCCQEYTELDLREKPTE